MGTINGPFAQRVDIILADLSSFLDALQGQPSFDVNRVVLVVATDASTQMPCCGQSLGECLWSSLSTPYSTTAFRPPTVPLCRKLIGGLPVFELLPGSVRLSQPTSFQTVGPASLEVGLL